MKRTGPYLITGLAMLDDLDVPGWPTAPRGLEVKAIVQGREARCVYPIPDDLFDADGMLDAVFWEMTLASVATALGRLSASEAEKVSA